MTSKEKEFRKQTAAMLLGKLLENPYIMVEEYDNRMEEYKDMDIYSFLADSAVNYTDALISRLEK